VAIHRKKRDAARVKRAKELAHLLGIHEAEAADLSWSGRLEIVAKLKAARRVEIARGRTGSWLYDLNRHLSLCAALRQEYKALAFFAESAGEGSGCGAGHRAAP
jgi:CRISPR/Cas system endoribonuclease Cas6 (RAMP superfamily)